MSDITEESGVKPLPPPVPEGQSDVQPEESHEEPIIKKPPPPVPEGQPEESHEEPTPSPEQSDEVLSGSELTIGQPEEPILTTSQPEEPIPKSEHLDVSGASNTQSISQEDYYVFRDDFIPNIAQKKFTFYDRTNNYVNLQYDDNPFLNGIFSEKVYFSLPRTSTRSKVLDYIPTVGNIIAEELKALIAKYLDYNEDTIVSVTEAISDEKYEIAKFLKEQKISDLIDNGARLYVFKNIYKSDNLYNLFGRGKADGSLLINSKTPYKC